MTDLPGLVVVVMVVVVFMVLMADLVVLTGSEGEDLKSADVDRNSSLVSAISAVATSGKFEIRDYSVGG